MENKKIYMAIADAMVDINAIGKTKKNQQQGFMFRGIDDAYNQLHPIMVKHRIFSVPEVIADKHEERTTKSGGHLIYRILTVRYTFFADDGSSIAAVVIGEGMDSGDKAASKAMAIAHKYALIQLFCVPTEDLIDPDYETQPESIPVEPIADDVAARQHIEGKIEKNMDILLPEFLTDVRSRMEGATVEVLRDIYGELRDEVKRIRAKETKAATDEGFAETAERVFNGKATKAKIPESLAKALKEKDAGEGFRDDSAELDKAVKSKKEPEQQDIF